MADAAAGAMGPMCWRSTGARLWRGRNAAVSSGSVVLWAERPFLRAHGSHFVPLDPKWDKYHWKFSQCLFITMPQSCISTMWECSLGTDTGLFYIKSFSQSICWSLVSLCVLAKCVLSIASTRVWQICMQDMVGSWDCTTALPVQPHPKLLHLSLQSVFHLESNAGRTTRLCLWLASLPSHQKGTVAIAREYSNSSLPC